MDAETKLIRRIARAIPSESGARKGAGRAAGGLRLGIGNDGAVLAPSGRTEWVLSCDAFLEGVHFLADRHPAESVGYKALARATSDLTAMGSTPCYFLLMLGLPLRRTGAWLDEFLRGMAKASRQLGIRLIGGDTKRHESVAVSITVLGEIAPRLAVTRAGARPGDTIYVSGKLGAAQLGLLMLKGARDSAFRPRIGGRFSPLQAHLYPHIRVSLGSWLARNRVASAMMDISDGLSTDLTRLCEASRIGARIWADRIPCVEVPPSRRGSIRPQKQFDPLELALNGGEDYELLFTVSPKNEKRLRRAPGFKDLTPIGQIERSREILLVGADGKAKPLVSGGWDPFRKK
ncbi:MAG TPA: thiamine-phosphate kinase [Candidatus Acidoferrales bacterium]|nr:thiamine-phosphate kinase [Candidatus Acidoferrales bacterium]